TSVPTYNATCRKFEKNKTYNRIYHGTRTEVQTDRRRGAARPHCNQLPAQLRHYPAVVRLLAAEHQYRHDGTGGVRRAEPLAATVGRGPQALSDPDAGSCEKQGVQCL